MESLSTVPEKKGRDQITRPIAASLSPLSFRSEGATRDGGPERGSPDSGLTGCRGNSVFTHRFSPGCTDIGRVSRSRAPHIIPIISPGLLFFLVLKCNTLLASGAVDASRSLFPIRVFCAGKFVVPGPVAVSFGPGRSPCPLRVQDYLGKQRPGQ